MLCQNATSLTVGSLVTGLGPALERRAVEAAADQSGAGREISHAAGGFAVLTDPWRADRFVDIGGRLDGR